ncbi:MAG: hypothetical protein JXB85_13970 [Anaerolineales bacterium]|nr:hypothetical protein [Anaerolineales bacterium]
MQRHIQQGLHLYLFLLPALIFLLLVQALEVVIGSNLPIADVPTVVRFGWWMTISSWIPLVLWGVFWLTSIIQISRDTVKPMNLISRIGALNVPKTISVGWGVFLQIGILLLVLVIARGNHLVNQNNANASVYLLYAEETSVPRWVYATGFYPIAEIAFWRWGEGSAAVEPLTRESLENAFREGRLIVIASHGGDPPGSVALSSANDDYLPSAADRMGGAGQNLQFVYFSGCFAGALESEWAQSLSPAKIITFNRVTWVLEHMLWLWTDGVIVALDLR